MATNLRPLHDRILVRREAEQQKTAGGIIIPDSGREKSQVGEVVAAGKGRTNKDGSVTPLDVKVGDRVLFGKYAGTETPRFQLDYDGEELLVIREEEILAILGEAKKSSEKSTAEKVGARR